MMTPGEKEAAGAEDLCEERRYYHWVFTINNPTEDDEHNVFGLSEDAKFVSVGSERGKQEETPHLQGFVSFTTMKSFGQLKELLPRAWLAVKSKRSTFAQAIDYTQKDGEFWEHGKRPDDPVDKGAREKEFWLEQLDCVRKRKFSEMDPKVKALHLSKLRYAVAAEEEEVQETVKDLVSSRQTHEWHYGAPDSGKSKHCRHYYTNPADVYTWEWTDAWWDGYKFQRIVHLEDVDESIGRRTSLLKKMADDHAFDINRKNLPKISIRPDQILVSSNVHPKDCYKGVHLAAILSRFKVVHWPEPYWLVRNVERNPKWFDPTVSVASDPLEGQYDPPSPPYGASRYLM